jgi:hypothetical protein
MLFTSRTAIEPLGCGFAHSWKVPSPEKHEEHGVYEEHEEHGVYEVEGV